MPTPARDGHRVYTFGGGAAEGEPTWRDADAQIAALGRKGAGLAVMSRLGLSVPPGFTVPCAATRQGPRWINTLWPEIERGLAFIEQTTGQCLGDPVVPLLLSVRSGAPVSMPGMMESVLNVGLTPGTLAALSEHHGAGFSLDCLARLLAGLTEVWPESIPTADVSQVKASLETLRRSAATAKMPPTVLLALLHDYVKRLGVGPLHELAISPEVQLKLALEGVAQSWDSRRATQYRQRQGISGQLGTAVTVQAMVFGNRDARSGAGVLMTRDPNTGEPRLFGEFLAGAQGPDVVGGGRTPGPLEDAERLIPEALAELAVVAKRLETELRDVQDVEFTVESGRLFVLQTRPAKRSARAAIRVAVDLVAEGLISEPEALLRVDAASLASGDELTVSEGEPAWAMGLPACPGVATGALVLDPDEAVRRALTGEAVILARPETSTDDYEAIRVAAGVLTLKGGMTSHAALVARALGRCCVTGLGELTLTEAGLAHGDTQVAIGARLTLDGTLGAVYRGAPALRHRAGPAERATLLGWADQHRRLKLAVSLSISTDAALWARQAQGADALFLRCEGLLTGRTLALKASAALTRRASAETLAPALEAAFLQALKVAGDRPVLLCLMDTHPSLPARGVRLTLTAPELHELQLETLLKARRTLGSQAPVTVYLPQVNTDQELRRAKRRLERVAAPLLTGPFSLGALIQTPKACLGAQTLAPFVEALAFDVDDLSRLAFGLEVGEPIAALVESQAWASDPLEQLDLEGVGELLSLGASRALASSSPSLAFMGAPALRPRLAEHLSALGLSWVFVDPGRLPQARLAAAQAALATSDAGVSQ